MASQDQKLVQVNGIGLVGFPGDMPDDEISAHIRKTVKDPSRLKQLLKPVPMDDLQPTADQKKQTHAKSGRSKGVTTEQSEKTRQTSTAQPLSSAIPDWVNQPLLPKAEALSNRVEDFVTRGGSKKLRDQQAAKMKEFDSAHPIQAGVAAGIKNFTEGMTTPTNIGLLLAAPESKVMSAYFALQAARGGYHDAKAAEKAYREGNNKEAAEYATQSFLGATVAGTAGAHAVKGTAIDTSSLRDYDAKTVEGEFKPVAPHEITPAWERPFDPAKRPPPVRPAGLTPVPVEANIARTGPKVAPTATGGALATVSALKGQAAALAPTKTPAALPAPASGAPSWATTPVSQPAAAVPEKSTAKTKTPKAETKSAEGETKYKYGNTQADIDPDSEAGKALAVARETIDKNDLMPSSNTSEGGGLENDAHITVRYGIDGEDTAGIKAYLEKQAPFEATLGKTTAFPPSEHSDGAAPIVASIESPELRRIEQEIDGHGNFIDRTFPDYKPHTTIAYVKPEAAQKYVGMKDTEGKKFTVNSVSISKRDGSKEEVQLKGKPGNQTTTPEFKQWFGDWEDKSRFSSKTADPNKPPVSVAIDPKTGEPLKMYHATSGDFNTFETGRPSKNSWAFGSWDTNRHGIFMTPDPQAAQQFLKENYNPNRSFNQYRLEPGSNVMPLYLKVVNPLDLRPGSSEVDEDFLAQIEKEGVNPRWVVNGVQDTWELFDDEDGEKFVAALKRMGYDGARLEEPSHESSVTGEKHRTKGEFDDDEEKGVIDTWVAFDPEQIKSATGNQGTFDVNNADITKNQSRVVYQSPAAKPEDISDVLTQLATINAELDKNPPPLEPIDNRTPETLKKWKAEHQEWLDKVGPWLDKYVDESRRLEALSTQNLGQIRTLRDGGKVLYLNPQGLRSLYAGFGGAPTLEFTLNGASLAANVFDPIMRNLDIRRPLHYAELQHLLTQARDANGVVTVSAIPQKGEKLSDALGRLREELNHGWQKAFADAVGNHLKDLKFHHLNVSMPGGMYSHLAVNYPEYPDDGKPNNNKHRVLEATAKLMSEPPQKFGVTEEEYEAYLKQYFEAVEQEHGEKALDELVHITTRARAAKEEFRNAKRGVARSAEGEGNVSGLQGRDAEATGPEEKRGVPEGNSGAIATRGIDWLVEGARDFAAKHGRDINFNTNITPYFRAMEIADAYSAMQHNPSDPQVIKAYDAMKKDIDEQWNYATKDLGVTFEPWKKEGQPYANSKEMTDDVKNNSHLYFFQGGDMPADHPLAEKTGDLTYNDKLRAVHDLFGHAMEGYQFGPRGEENAWNAHSQMFSPEALPAVTSETKGQNSWVNYGPHMRNAEGGLMKPGEPGYIAPPDRPFAEQKAGLLPEHYHYRVESPVSFVSPSVHDLNIEQAGIRAGSRTHRMMASLSNSLATDLKLKPVVRAATGFWEGGAENTIVHHFAPGADPDAVLYHAQNMAKLGNQKAQMTFFPQEGGPDKMYAFEVPKDKGDTATIAKLLLSNGITGGTIEPTPHGNTVLVSSEGGKHQSTIDQITDQLGVQHVGEIDGLSVLQGDWNDAAAAAREFDKHIGELEQKHPEWKQVREAFESRPDYADVHRLIRETKPEDLFLEATHGSRVPDITELDPGKGGTGPQKGAETQRQQADPDIYPPRTYLQEKGTRPEMPYGRLPNQYESTLNRENYYDLEKDPDKLKADIPAEYKQDPRRALTYLEKLVKDHGYDGVRDPRYGVLESFAKVPVRKAGASAAPAKAASPSQLLVEAQKLKLGGTADKDNAFMADMFAQTAANPFNPRESVWENRACFEIYPFDGMMHLSSIRSLDPGTGGGSGALKFLTDLADKHGITIQADPVPYGSKRLSAKKLEAWYKRHGFKDIGTSALTRKPVEPVDVEKSKSTSAQSAMGKILEDAGFTKSITIEGDKHIYTSGKGASALVSPTSYNLGDAKGKLFVGKTPEELRAHLEEGKKSGTLFSKLEEIREEARKLNPRLKKEEYLAQGAKPKTGLATMGEATQPKNLNDFIAEAKRRNPEGKPLIEGRDFDGFFATDNYDLRHATGHNMLDPESVISGAEISKGMTYANSRRQYPDIETYVKAASGDLSAGELQRVAPRVRIDGPEPVQIEMSKQRKPGPNNPGVGVADETLHGVWPAFRVMAPKDAKIPDKPLVIARTTNDNAAKYIPNLDTVLDKHPDAGKSIDDWTKMTAYALGTRDVVVPPYAFIRDLNGDGAERKLETLTPEQIEHADFGLQNAAEFRRAYTNGELGVATTGKLFLWSILSRGQSPYVQESLFIDAFNGAAPWIDKAARGEFTEKDMKAYTKWADTVAPLGSNLPGAGAIHNLNSFGRHFLVRMSKTGADGRTHLQHLHDMMSDPKMTGKEIRREFNTFKEGVGVDNKVMSFSLLATGHKDIMVLDRVQFRNLWDDGRFNNLNLYDGTIPEGMASYAKNSRLAELGGGVRGLLYYEAIEKAIGDRVKDIYKNLGRPDDASIGRYHWETWVASSGQEASHETLNAVFDDAKGDDMAIAGVAAHEGEFGSFQYGTEYYRDEYGKPFFTYKTPLDNRYGFSVPNYRGFLADIKRGSSGVIPSKYRVELKPEDINASIPWYKRPGVDQQKLDELAKSWSDFDPREGRRASEKSLLQQKTGADSDRTAFDFGSGGVGPAALLEQAKALRSGVEPVGVEMSKTYTGPERRQENAFRKRVSEMTPEEMKTVLLRSYLVDLPNRRAFDEDQLDNPAPAVARSDADALKAFNDKFGYEYGDTLLHAKADALKEVGLNAYHEKGDEFLFRGESAEDLKTKLEKAREILRDTIFDVTLDDGTKLKLKGVDFSYGTGKNLDEAEAGQHAHKEARERAGERRRGELAGITEIGAGEDQEDPQASELTTVP